MIQTTLLHTSIKILARFFIYPLIYFPKVKNLYIFYKYLHKSNEDDLLINLIKFLTVEDCQKLFIIMILSTCLY